MQKSIAVHFPGGKRWMPKSVAWLSIRIKP